MYKFPKIVKLGTTILDIMYNESVIKLFMLINKNNEKFHWLALSKDKVTVTHIQLGFKSYLKLNQAYPKLWNDPRGPINSYQTPILIQTLCTGCWYQTKTETENSKLESCSNHLQRQNWYLRMLLHDNTILNDQTNQENPKEINSNRIQKLSVPTGYCRCPYLYYTKCTTNFSKTENKL